MQQKKNIDRLSDLYYLILQLDGIRAFRRVGTDKIESAFHSIHATNVWKLIKPDIEAIIYLPNTIPGLLRLMKIAMTLRAFFPIGLVLMILALLIRLGLAPMLPPPIFYALLTFPVLVMLAFVSVDLVIRKRIARYEEEHPTMQSEEKEHIKAAIQELIMKLSKEITSRGENPSDYKMRLFYNDYEGIEIIKEHREKIFGIFKRKYSTYIAIPSLTA